MFLGSETALESGGNDSSPQALREEQRVPGLSRCVGFDTRRVDCPGHGIAEFHFVVGDAVTSDDRAGGFVHLFGAALQNLLQIGDLASRRKRQDRKS